MKPQSILNKAINDIASLLSILAVVAFVGYMGYHIYEHDRVQKDKQRILNDKAKYGSEVHKNNVYGI